MIKVKICGITNTEDALSAQEAGVDFIGFVFADSPRKISPEKANEIIKIISSDIKVVALFVNKEKEAVESVLNKLSRVDALQFHGDETAQYCEYFKYKEVIKAFRIKNEGSIGRIKDFDSINYVMLDTYKEGAYGGTGHTFNWDIALKAKVLGKPLFLSGGLTPENVKEAVKKTAPYAVDVSSGVEKAPGKKDPKRIKEFIEKAKTV